jgi:hypothetical protein
MENVNVNLVSLVLIVKIRFAQIIAMVTVFVIQTNVNVLKDGVE